MNQSEISVTPLAPLTGAERIKRSSDQREQKQHGRNRFHDHPKDTEPPGDILDVHAAEPNVEETVECPGKQSASETDQKAESQSSVDIAA